MSTLEWRGPIATAVRLTPTVRRQDRLFSPFVASIPLVGSGGSGGARLGWRWAVGSLAPPLGSVARHTKSPSRRDPALSAYFPLGSGVFRAEKQKTRREKGLRSPPKAYTHSCSLGPIPHSRRIFRPDRAFFAPRGRNRAERRAWQPRNLGPVAEKP